MKTYKQRFNEELGYDSPPRGWQSPSGDEEQR